MAKSARGQPPLKRTKLSKKLQERQYYIQEKLYEANRWWNDWKFQLHQIKLEWVDPQYSPKIFKPFSIASKHFYINTNDRTAHFVGHSRLKNQISMIFMKENR